MSVFLRRCAEIQIVVIVKSDILGLDILKERLEVKLLVMLYDICCHNEMIGSSLNDKIAVQTTKLAIVVEH